MERRSAGRCHFLLLKCHQRRYIFSVCPSLRLSVRFLRRQLLPHYGGIWMKFSQKIAHIAEVLLFAIFYYDCLAEKGEHNSSHISGRIWIKFSQNVCHHEIYCILYRLSDLYNSIMEKELHTALFSVFSNISVTTGYILTDCMKNYLVGLYQECPKFSPGVNFGPALGGVTSFT